MTIGAPPVELDIVRVLLTGLNVTVTVALKFAVVVCPLAVALVTAVVTAVCAATTVGLAPAPEKLAAAVWPVVATAEETAPATGSPPALTKLADPKAKTEEMHNTLSMDFILF